jgi:hypothetical protein
MSCLRCFHLPGIQDLRLRWQVTEDRGRDEVVTCFLIDDKSRKLDAYMQSMFHLSYVAHSKPTHALLESYSKSANIKPSVID